jgi:MoxR-like ATPase
VIVGQEHMVETLMVSLLAKGHCLLEGVPGVAKTLAVRTFAPWSAAPSPDPVHARTWSRPTSSAPGSTGRPGDVRHRARPEFVNFVLADEINRAPAKVQSAMLELMAERQVSIGGQTFPMPKPFIVIATQNPIESEGVYPLPEAQRDRFLVKIDVPHPRGTRSSRSSAG